MAGVPPLSDEVLLAAVEAYKNAGGNQEEAARQMGIPGSTLKSRIKTAAKRGFMGFKPVLEGFEVSRISSTLDPDGNVKSQHIQQKPEASLSQFNVPVGHVIKGVSALVDANGNQQMAWYKTKEGEIDPIYMAERIKTVFDYMVRDAGISPEPVGVNADLLTLIPLADLHMGLSAYHREADVNWDLKTAVSAYKNTIAQVCECAPASDTAVILGGGDLVHANTNDYRTQSGNVLDGDSRIDKVIDTTIQLVVFAVDTALLKHKRVIVRILKGNHDEYSSIAIVHAIAAWYRNEPRVEVDTDPSLFWWWQHGEVMLGATHGHAAKVTEMPLIMANRKPKEWGDTKHRYIHMFHIHHKTQRIFENGGVIAESHQSPVAQDAYHFGQGYLSGRSMQAISYHRTKGEIVRNTVSL